MVSVLLALSTSLGYGAADFLAGWAARRIAPVLIVLYVQALQSVAVLFIALGTAQPLSVAALLWGLSSGFVNAVGLLLYYRALTFGPVGVVSPIVASGAVVPIVLSAVQGNSPGILGYLGLATVLAGVIVSAVARSSDPVHDEGASPPCRGATRPLRDQPPVDTCQTQAVVLAVVAALAFGGYFVLVDRASATAATGVLWVTFGVQVGTLPLAVASAFYERLERFTVAGGAALVTLGGITVFNLGADASLAYALQGGNLGIVSVLSSLGPVITGVLARLLSKERLTWLQLLGSCLIVVGTLTVLTSN